MQIFARVDPHLLRRLRRETVFDLLDPYKTGSLDADMVADLEVAASTEIAMALGTKAGVYDTFPEPFAQGLELLAVDMMVARLGMRYPAVIGVDYMAIWNDTRKRLDMIRKGQMSLGESPPDPASNHGGVVLMGGAQVPIFSNNKSGKWGVF